MKHMKPSFYFLDTKFVFIMCYFIPSILINFLIKNLSKLNFGRSLKSKKTLKFRIHVFTKANDTYSERMYHEFITRLLWLYLAPPLCISSPMYCKSNGLQLFVKNSGRVSSREIATQWWMQRNNISRIILHMEVTSFLLFVCEHVSSWNFSRSIFRYIYHIWLNLLLTESIWTKTSSK
jgi:hypothetical protein